MHKSKDQLYQQIKDIKSKEEFKKEIQQLQNEYDQLLDDNTAALLIVDELGRNKQSISKINMLEPGMECTVFGRVTNYNQSRNFNRKNGSTGQVINLELTDDTGTCRLALWNRDVELVKNKTIKIGTNVKIINGYIKNGFNGIEINVGRWGLIEIEPEDMIDLNKEKCLENKVIRGKIFEIEPTRAFFKDNGEFGFVTDIKLETKEGIIQITVWDEKVKDIQKLKQGNSVEIEDIDIRQKNGKKEYHVNSKGVIKKI
jgi:replication factor A1